MARHRKALGLALLLVLSPACSQLLGIEDARVDATLGLPDTAAGSAGTTADSTSGGAPSAGTSPGAESAGKSGHDYVVGGESGGGVPASGEAGAPSTPSLCEQYCDEVTTNCKGKYEQYRTFDQCVEVCKRLPAGQAGDDDVNSVSCRLRQAEFAASEPFVYCKSAGPLGAGRCGSNCISYCSLMQATCTAASTAGNLEASYFESSQDCVAACTALPTDQEGPVQYSSSATAEPSSFVGNNVFCRTYHVAAALEQDTPDEHCPHAMGGDPCLQQ